MLVVSPKRYLPVAVNTLVLHAGGLYFYIHRDVYDQAVILADQYAELDELSTLVGGGADNRETARWFYSQAPKPLNILAPFLNLIEGELERDLELCCGALHVITSLIQVRHFIHKPQEVRKSVSFSLSIKDEYEMAWESFLMTAIPYEKRHLAMASALPVYQEQAAGFEVQQSAPERAYSAETAPIQALPVEALATSMLEGFSVRREEEQAEAPKSMYASTAAEKKATKQLLL